MAEAGWYPDPDDGSRWRYWDGAEWTEHRSEHGSQQATAPAPPAPEPAANTAVAQPILRMRSHEKGGDSFVSLWPDRIERVEARRGLTRKPGVQVTPMRSVTSVQTMKDGMTYSRVMVMTTAGMPIEFRLPRKDADQLRDAITALLLA